MNGTPRVREEVEVKAGHCLLSAQRAVRVKLSTFTENAVVLTRPLCGLIEGFSREDYYFMTLTVKGIND